MKFYVAASVGNKQKVLDLQSILLASGHEVSVDWASEESIPEDDRENRLNEVSALAKRDFRGIQNADIFILLANPPEGRSMYVEIGVALSNYERVGYPQVYVIGTKANQSIFYYHPSVTRLESIEGILNQWVSNERRENKVEHEGRLEEFRALRAEMLQIINDRIWGQATYAVLAGALLVSDKVDRSLMALFTIALSIPFLIHTIFREESRLRMANYIAAFLEPNIPGMKWEQYLTFWRQGLKKEPALDWLKKFQKVKHILSLSGLYLFASICSLVFLFQPTCSWTIRIVGIGLFLLILCCYVFFWQIYVKAKEEQAKLPGCGFAS